MYQKMLNTIWENPNTRHLYVTTLEIIEEARFPETYDEYKAHWHDQEHGKALKLLLKLGWHEPKTVTNMANAG